ncbi:MAG: TMEM165/GDT1 family protein [Candidatus Omnitrophica bacterium]|nr:TMEM165/GDT1 family protein [Candidatus Omnitrophota bacterium]MBU1870420.1 TMEM165/GDT1 family protein [Candidatus Omnitrophota bacterium]
MDWKVFFMTFGAVFFAELADKTQLVGIGMTSKTGKPLSVWFGSVCAYMIVTLLSVLIGMVLSKHLNPDLIRYSGAALFIIIGVLMIFKIL